MPAEQCTKTFPLPAPFLDDEAIAESMILQATSTIFEMGEEVVSLMERRWYVTPSTLLPCEGLAPMLSTSVMEFDVRNCLDDAAKHGPKYRDGGRTSETGLWGGLDDRCCRFPIVWLTRTRERHRKIRPDDEEGERRAQRGNVSC